MIIKMLSKFTRISILTLTPRNSKSIKCVFAVTRSSPFCSTTIADTESNQKIVDDRYQREIEAYVKSHWDDSVTKNDWLVQRLKRRLAAGDRAALAEAITLVESRHPTKKAQAEYLLAELLASAKRRYDQRGVGSLMFRVGITGSPGVGKSSFIEVFGKYLIDQHKKKVAVLAIDPSSQTTGGSIMGDIARMPELSRDPNSYLRSSATRGTLGGVAAGTNEAVIVCEGAGYDWVMIETVGVGQSEGAVAKIVDMVIVLISPAQGDELQGIKRGLMELADLVVVTKADGDLQGPARITQAEFISAMKLQRPRWPGVWKPKVLRSSAKTKEGISDVYNAAEEFRKALGNSGDFMRQRYDQTLSWMWTHVEHEIMGLFKRHPQILRRLPDVEDSIRQGRTTAGLAAERLLREFLGL